MIREVEQKDIFGFEHIGTEKYDFFSFTCGYMEKNFEY